MGISQEQKLEVVELMVGGENWQSACEEVVRFVCSKPSIGTGDEQQGHLTLTTDVSMFGEIPNPE